MANYFQVKCIANSAQQKEILVALLSSIDFEGFEETGNQLTAFIQQNIFDKIALEEIMQLQNLDFTIEEIAEQNWNQLWESNFSPVVVNNFCSIRAHFHEPIPNVQHEIVITPKMSFGTGHHATTYMMIEAMQGLDINQKKVFDFGTGTGVLAILATKMGADTIEAIDNDNWSIENAKENFERNLCNHINLYQAETLPIDKKYDVILANINKNVILHQMQHLAEHLANGGVLLLSGLLKDDENDILSAAANYHLASIGCIEKNSWICLKMQAKGF